MTESEYVFPEEIPFPDKLVGDILQALQTDSKFHFDEVLRSTDKSPDQIAFYAASLTMSDDWRRWHERLDRWTYTHIHNMVNQYLAEPSDDEPEAVDPLAAQAETMSEWDPWARAAAIHDPRYTTVIGGDGDLGITDTRDVS